MQKVSLEKGPLTSHGSFSPFDGTSDSVIDFLRRRLPMTLAINTIIALLIALLLHSWDEVIPNLVVAYCIGLTILALVASVRCTVMQRFRGRVQMRYVIYFAVIVAGAIGGESLSRLFLRGGYSLATNMHEGYVWIVAVVFSLVAGSIALFINFSWVKLAQSRRDVERAERAAIEAQLRALQAQIEPHFLLQYARQSRRTHRCGRNPGAGPARQPDPLSAGCLDARAQRGGNAANRGRTVESLSRHHGTAFAESSDH